MPRDIGPDELWISDNNFRPWKLVILSLFSANRRTLHQILQNLRFVIGLSSRLPILVS